MTPSPPLSGSHAADLLSVFDVVASGRATTRAEVAGALGMRPTTVSLLVAELSRRDLIRDHVVRGQGRGRPTAFLAENRLRLVALYLHIVSSTIYARIVDRTGRVLATVSVSPPQQADNAAMARAMHELARQALGHLPAGAYHVATVCSLSGLLDVGARLWCFSSRWPRIDNLDLCEVLKDLGPEPVLVRNMDAELAGRIADGPADARNVLLLHWGYGIGGAFATPDGIINQDRGRFCEIGHWRLDSHAGRPCTCGNVDCLETVAALWALYPVLSRRFPDLPLDEARLGPLAARFDLLQIPEMAEALRQTVRITSNLCRLLFPEKIILTGPFLQSPSIFTGFSESLFAAPILHRKDMPMVVQGEDGAAAFEMAGALHAPLRAALLQIISA
ncbi:ROK family protein [Paracoccus pacificus]|uniref:ROK family protein n=1 Tax=Paracoccus pacificus TaxID=1463598 RepID=A0ABW4R574_9RHOB